MKRNHNRFKYLFTAKATRKVRLDRTVQITDDTKESAFERLSRMNQYWTIDEKSMKKRKIKDSEDTIYC